MKKIISILLCGCFAAVAFAACSGKGENYEATTTTIGPAPTITTDQAKIIQEDAINLIKSYSAEELSLTEEEKKLCAFMVASSGTEIDGDYYVQVIVTYKNTHKDDEGNTTYTFDNRGEYFIRYDGKQILKKDMTKDTDEYIELEVKTVPSTEARE